ncbi:MAG TPA: zinc metalloprotease HtpX [Armatimonadota bacterium]|jgi:heat shock protein HtpX
MNTLKTVLLMGIMTGLFLLVGYWVGGQQGMWIALGLAAVMNMASYWFSDRIVLATYRAQPLTPDQAPELYGIVRRLADRAQLPMPRLFLIPDPSPNAFATGRDPEHAVVVVTQGIVGMLDQPELEGVLAHELSHVSNRDILISAIAATLAGALMIIARMAFFFGGGRDREGGGLGALLTLIFAPIAAVLIRMAISRSREYQADAAGAALTGNPLGLAHALAKLEAGVQQVPLAGADPNSSHLFIVNPLRGNWLAGLFSTHPPIQARIDRLERMARG